MIEVSHVTKAYGTHRAVENLSFTLEEGKIYGLLGPNGAGKSTTMNIMTGYLAASDGSVRINGCDILLDAVRAKAQIGYLPEIPPLYKDMTVLEYLFFAAELKRIPKALRREQVLSAIEKTKLTDYRERLIRNLSKGYQQRTGLAQAILGEPKIMILDEPTVGLDPHQIIEVRELIRSFREGHIVILSSHILSEISEVCDEILIISGGRLIAQGSIAELEERFGKEDSLRLSLKRDGSADFDERVQKALTDAGFRPTLSRAHGAVLEEIFLRITEQAALHAESGETDA